MGDLYEREERENVWGEEPRQAFLLWGDLGSDCGCGWRKERGLPSYESGWSTTLIFARCVPFAGHWALALALAALGQSLNQSMVLAYYSLS